MLMNIILVAWRSITAFIIVITLNKEHNEQWLLQCIYKLQQSPLCWPMLMHIQALIWINYKSTYTSYIGIKAFSLHKHMELVFHSANKQCLHKQVQAIAYNKVTTISHRQCQLKAIQQYQQATLRQYICLYKYSMMGSVYESGWEDTVREGVDKQHSSNMLSLSLSLSYSYYYYYTSCCHRIVLS